jgi:hypothetical protein
LPKNEIWEEYPEVYHYTNFSTVLLIIHSGTLRATRFDLLNDTEEINYAKSIIATKIKEKKPQLSIEKAKRSVEYFLEPLGVEFYIASFCGKNSTTNPYHHDNGLLSMWRNYGADGGGAIAFNTKNIFTTVARSSYSPDTPPAVVMNEVVYQGENDANEDYQKSLDRFASHVSELIDDPLPNRELMIDPPPPNDEEFYRVRELLADLLYLTICSKHPAFFEEREVRIGLCFINNIAKKRLAVPLQPFHEIQLSPPQDILRIIIGPHKDQKERFNFLKSYLSAVNPDIEVSMSDIPLRV